VGGLLWFCLELLLKLDPSSGGRARQKRLGESEETHDGTNENKRGNALYRALQGEPGLNVTGKLAGM